MSTIIKQDEMDEAVLMTRTLALLGHINNLFHDHGRKPLSLRAQGIKSFLQRELRKANPYDTKDPEKGFTHQYFITEVLGEEVLNINDLSDLHYAVTDGHFSGETNATNVTWTNRALTDELLMTQGSDSSFLNKGDDEEDEP